MVFSLGFCLLLLFRHFLIFCPILLDWGSMVLIIALCYFKVDMVTILLLYHFRCWYTAIVIISRFQKYSTWHTYLWHDLRKPVDIFLNAGIWSKHTIIEAEIVKICKFNSKSDIIILINQTCLICLVYPLPSQELPLFPLLNFLLILTSSGLEFSILDTLHLHVGGVVVSIFSVPHEK